jgi:hypothetical protein
LLIRDSMEALRKHWGHARLERWLAEQAARDKIDAILCEDFERPGFPSLAERLMAQTEPETVKQFLRELGTHVPAATRLDVGGSVALILPGYVSRHTEDIDVVDEVPAPVRSLHQVRAELKQRYGLAVAHFQSHYLPAGWQNRLHLLGAFGNLQVYTVDVIDIFLCKLFSKRAKDLDDLRLLAPQLDKPTLVRRLKDTTAQLSADPAMHEQAEHNWYVLYGEPLPS